MQEVPKLGTQIMQEVPKLGTQIMQEVPKFRDTNYARGA